MSLIRYRPSLLERLCDSHPDDQLSLPQDVSLKDIRDSVIRDLNDLVNTRRLVERELPAHYPELRNSILTYGLARRSLLGTSNFDAERIRIELERAIERCEPRLKEVHVELLGGPRIEPALLRFQIKAILCVPPTPQEIALAAELPLHPQLISVSDESATAAGEPAPA